MWTQRRCLFGGGSTSYVQLSLLIILVSLPSCCCSKASSSTTPSPSPSPSPFSSSCGHIRNIGCPFRLEGDHQKCDGVSYELSCHNNRTVINFPMDLKNRYYYVEDINYQNYTVRVVDPGLDKDNYSCSSLPLHFLPATRQYSSLYTTALVELNTAMTFIDCPAPATSIRYIKTEPCSLSPSISNNDVHSYVVIGYMDSSEVEDYCTVRKTTWVLSRWWTIFKDITTFLLDIHGMVNYGFELPFSTIFYENCTLNCRNLGTCYWSGNSYCLDFDFCSPNLLCPVQSYSILPPCDLSDILYSYHLTFSCSLRYNLLSIGAWFNDNLSSIGKVFGKVYAVRFLCGTPFLLALLVYKWRRRHLSVYDIIEDFLQGQTNLMPIRYNYWEIKKITNSFKDKLGEGGFGTVYKGKLRSGFLVAVKILGKSKASGQEFINEVATIGRIHHVNVVQLLGFCFEGSKRALIYEFMPNGSLEKYIFPKEGEEEGMTTLSCQKMYEISFKVAGGVEYLHRGCDMQILHFDIKPHNILLDENFNPKISDFGLAKLYATDDSIVTLTAARGTMGYMAPELFYKNIGGVSYKADVYSFGMLLMEMAGRRKNLNPFVENTSQIYFPSWVYDQFNEGKEIEMEDASEEERKLVKKMVIVALWCIQMKPSDRPSMNKVIEMLEGDVEILMMPPKPFLCPQEAPVEDQEIECHQN